MTDRPFEPMLAGSFIKDVPIEQQLKLLRYPLAMQPKYDGVRVLCHWTHGVVKRKLEFVDNQHIRSELQRFCYANLDGEVVVVDAAGKPCKFQESQSAVSTIDGTPNFRMIVFDSFAFPGNGFLQRYHALKQWHEPKVSSGNLCLELAPLKVASNVEQVMAYYNKCLDAGHEGAMIRRLDSPYKYGRSTLNESYLLKLKPFEDAEAVVLGFEEMLSNQNEDVKNAMGRAKRGHSKAGMVPAGTLGKFLVRGVGGQFDGVEFAIGGGRGLTRQLRDTIWAARQTYIGKIITYEYQVVGVKDKPRCPVFKGFRRDA